MNGRTIDIGGRPVGVGHPAFVIAEAGVNHNGDVDMACRLVDAAAEAGADAVKFQTFRAERLVSANAPQAEYAATNLGGSTSQYDMLKALELTDEDHRRLFRYCEERRILFLSSPFDEESADFLESLDVLAFKVPSGELTNLGYLAHIAAKSRPMIISTGMADLGEVEAAVRAVEGEGNYDYVLLHCVSNYPAAAEDANLRAMLTLEAAFGNPVGYSDHTLGLEVPLAAVALGACVIEKHLTLDRSLPGPDHQASSEPDELANLVRGIRTVEAALGTGRKRPASSEASTASVVRKSLVSARDLTVGTVLTEAAITAKRPGTGLPLTMRPYVLGRLLRVDVPADTVLTLDMLE